jgi:hypothetical protein
MDTRNRRSNTPVPSLVCYICYSRDKPTIVKKNGKTCCTECSLGGKDKEVDQEKPER